MDFWTYVCCLLLLHTSQVLAYNLGYKQPSPAGFKPDSKALEILEHDWKQPSLELERLKKIKEDRSEPTVDDDQAISPHARKSLRLKPGSTWWPSKVDYSDTPNEIPKSSYESADQGVRKTFEELENENANVHNPLLNLDHYPIPSKKYTFEELENMNANQYNPYLN